MDSLALLLDRADAFLAALVAAVGTWLASRESRRTNLRATLDSSASETIGRLGETVTRLEDRVNALEKKVGVADEYAVYAIGEMRRVEDHLEANGLHWPPPPPMSFYAWLNERDKL